MTDGLITEQDRIATRDRKAAIIESGGTLPISRYHADTLAKQAEVEAREAAVHKAKHKARLVKGTSAKNATLKARRKKGDGPADLAARFKFGA